MKNNTNEIQASMRVVAKSKSINPVMAVICAVLLALIISTINLVLFIRSDMYEKVRRIQNPEQVLTSDEILDTSSPITSDQLKVIKKDIDSQFEKLRDDKDFSIYDVSEATLGL
jgi:hypothetical protein